MGVRGDSHLFGNMLGEPHKGIAYLLGFLAIRHPDMSDALVSIMTSAAE
jgi:hypothetical protein